MSKLKNLIIVFTLFGCSIFAQNLWTSEVQIDFIIQSNTKAAAYVNTTGIHIVYFRNGGIKYALVNSQGGIIKYDKVIEAEGSGANFANVAVVNGNIYAIYYKNNDIKVAKSTNLGNTWNNTFSSYDCINTGCSKIVAYSDIENIHITWSEFRSGNYTDVHYVKFTPSSPTPWTEYKRVSDLTTPLTEGGENPDLVLTSGKVFVNYIGNYHTFPVNRDKSFGSPWNNPEDIPFDELPMTNLVSNVKPLIIGDELNTIYVNSWAGPESGDLISHSYKNVLGTSWTQNEDYLETYRIDPNTIFPNVSASTADGKIHFIYRDKDLSTYSYRQINNHTFSDHIANIPLANYLSNVLIPNSNDLYLIKTGNVDLPGKILFRHYDAAPLPPQNLQVVQDANNHPYLTWIASKEPDKSSYIIEKCDACDMQWYQLTQTSYTFFEDPTEVYCTQKPCQQSCAVIYRVSAVDLNDHTSDPSNEATAYVTGHFPHKEIGQNPDSNIPAEYVLDQNYPNPFNPTTTISYGLKEAGFVTLKVYDMLGREVAELVNENQNEGYHTTEFNAVELPSGIYFYQIKSGSFSDMKKMLLIK